MAGGRMKYRHFNRSSAHRQAMLRNLVTSLFTHESIATTWHKAKEAQRLAEKLVTLGKKNTEASKRKAFEIFYTPHELVPKLFGEIRKRYELRPGGYTRVLRIEPLKPDMAPSAILELVDWKHDMRFQMTARTLAKERADGREKPRQMTAKNIEKVTRYRKGGMHALDDLVESFAEFGVAKERDNAASEEKRWGGNI
ncbi:54S ribosomal protein L8, mitochondrial [Lachnellula subtilissima]|uniref:Large ribosomal subunit protein bL17m n=1 Tax=Lachnellula subtilissima TaxID=602034 RepID=A0A8H8UC44_9HELO|nr:54S ribosomal protein L8, mitochondrial [Lachnellula subtilissima]